MEVLGYLFDRRSYLLEDVMAVSRKWQSELEEYIRQTVGCKVYILNPGKLAVIYMSTRKTDKEDALKLAKLLKNHDEDELPIVTPPTDEEWERRKLLSEYKSLKGARTREVNKLHAIFEHAGYTQFKRKDMCCEKNRNNMR